MRLLIKNDAEKFRAIRHNPSVFPFPAAHGIIWIRILCTIYKKQEEIEMENQQRNGKDAEMTIIDGMPATVLTGTTRTPQPWED